MNKYSGAIILTLFVFLLVFSIVKTLPSQEVKVSSTPLIRNTAYPLTSLLKPECRLNSPDLFIIEPKLYEHAKARVRIVGQAVGSYDNTVSLAIKDQAGKVLLQDVATVGQSYPCEFQKEFIIGNIGTGSFSVVASLRSSKDGGVAKEAEVSVFIE